MMPDETDATRYERKQDKGAYHEETSRPVDATNSSFEVHINGLLWCMHRGK